MKKILILAMSCNQEFFIKQEELIHQTYAYDIVLGKQPDIDFWSYKSSNDGKYHCQKLQHFINVPADDSLNGTFEKTQMALKLLSALNIEYDYILHTNCSTYINVPVLRSFIEKYGDEETIWSGGVYSTVGGSGPYDYCPYGVGNALIIPKKWCDILKTCDIEKYKQYDFTTGDDNKSIYHIDDNAIGFVINSILINEKKNVFDYWKSFKMPMINTITETPENYMCIPFRLYTGDRHQEYKIVKDIHQHMELVQIRPDTVADSIINDPIIHIINFSAGFRQITKRKEALKYIKQHSKIPYL